MKIIKRMIIIIVCIPIALILVVQRKPNCKALVSAGILAAKRDMVKIEKA